MKLNLRGVCLLYFVVLVQPEGEEVEESLKNEVFSCSVELRDMQQKVLCTNRNTDTITMLSKLYIAELQGVCRSFTLDEHCVWKKSSFYICEAFYMVTDVNDSLLRKCRSDPDVASKFIKSLNESFIDVLRVSSNLTLNDISKGLSGYYKLKDVTLQGSYLPYLNESLINKKNDVNRLSLKENGIEIITNDALRNFSALTSLVLSENNIQNLTGSIFKYLSQLEFLDLSSNNIRILPTDAFSGLSNLKVLLLRKNNISHIDSNSLHFNSVLSTLDLSGNSFVFLIHDAFQKFSVLQNTSCSNCNYTTIDEGMFGNSTNLMNVDLSFNRIVSVNKNAFSSLKDLKYLNLAYNLITKLSSATFKQFNLRRLNLTHNNIERLKRKTFYNAMNIRVLDLSWNKLREFTDAHVKTFTDLEYLDLRNNNLNLVELGVTIDVKVRKIYLSNNSIVKFNVGWKRLLYLEVLDISHNDLTHIDLPPCIPNVKQTVTFSFQHNSISRIHMETLLKDEKAASTDRTMAHCFFIGKAKNFVNLTHNPLFCDCTMYPFYDYSKRNDLVRGRIDLLINAENLTCAGPTRLQGKQLVALSDNDFSCSFRDECPSPCECGIRGKDSSQFVNCSGKKLVSVPQHTPPNITVLYFNDNILKNISSLNNVVWKNLVEAYLDDNMLTNLEGWNFPSSLRLLSVRGNDLKHLPVPLVRLIEKHNNFRLFFSGNEEICDCNAKDSRNFLFVNKEKIGDFSQIVCNISVNGSAKFVSPFSIPDGILCLSRSADLRVIGRWLIPLIILATSFVMAVVAFRFVRQPLFSLLFAKFGICANDEDDDDEDKIYDAFVAYGSNDRAIVMDLLKELEQGAHPCFRLCIHERDWVPGRFINDNILDSVRTSRRTIVILSETFAASPWFAIELRAAMLSEASHIIVILVDKTTKLEVIDPDLRDIVTCRTYLVWGERWFWEKLRYAMPHKKRNADERRISETLLLPC